MFFFFLREREGGGGYSFVPMTGQHGGDDGGKSERCVFK